MWSVRSGTTRTSSPDSPASPESILTLGAADCRDHPRAPDAEPGDDLTGAFRISGGDHRISVRAHAPDEGGPAHIITLADSTLSRVEHPTTGPDASRLFDPS